MAGDFCRSDVSARPSKSSHSSDEVVVDSPQFNDSVGPVSKGLPDLHSVSSSGISFLNVIQSVLQVSAVAHVGLKQFLQLSMQPQSRSVHGARCDSDMWPCPIPQWCWAGPKNLSPKRRRRRRFHQIRSQVLQHVIGVLNWESLGHPLKPPARACIGNCFSDHQWLMICRLERLVDHFLRAEPVSAKSLGRSFEKFSTMLAFAKELPECREVDLFNLVQEVAKDLDPYQSKPPTTCRDQDDRDRHKDCCHDAPVSKLSMSVAKPVIASRIKWEHSPAFDPIPFFKDQIVRDAFVNPDSVKLPSHQWVVKAKGRVHCSRAELLKLAEKWDSKGACRIFRVDEINLDEAVGLFGVPKDAEFDRMILNPQVVNGRMKSFSHYTKQLAPGSLFTLIRLPPELAFRINADDLAEMYYTIKVPDSRAKRNSIGVIFDASALSHLSCFDPSKHRGPCVVALGALAMGDSWAVEFAQQAHHNVLRFLAGSMLEHQRVAYRRAFPRGLFLEWLSIDDHIGVQIVTWDQLKNCTPLRDSEVFSRAESAYKQVGLVQHPKKKQRGVTQGTFLGAEVDGRTGFVSSPRTRIAVLMLCTVVVARKGITSPRLLSSILGCWIHVLMFRRPVLSILSHVFSEGKSCKQDELFCLSQISRNELLAICLLGPVCTTDLRVDVAPFIYCTDASPHGAGICVCPEDRVVVEELWRHSEQRGYYTRLLNPAASVLSEMGLDHIEENLPDTNASPLDEQLRIPAPLAEGFVYDCIELFRGEGNWSLAHEAIGLRVHPGIDVKSRGISFGDFLDNAVFHLLISLALRGVVRDWHAGTPCRTYGTLRRPRIRSKLQPSGFNIADPLTREQTLLAIRTAFLMNLVISRGCFFSIEQPGSSVMFYLAIFKRLVMQGCVITKFCFCSFGSPFKKPSKWLHNKPWLLELEGKCSWESTRQHFIIEGSFTKSSVVTFDEMCQPSAEAVYGRLPKPGEAVAAFSGSYPKPLCSQMAAGSLHSMSDTVPVVPVSAKLLSMQRVGIDIPMDPSIKSQPLADYRPFHEDPVWVEELSDSLDFKELLRYRFKKTGHINVLECRVHKTWLKHCAKHHPDSRTVALLDSRVTLGATSKGRSSSRALCRVLRGSLAYILGGGLYPGGIHIGSKKNRSDPPSRNRRVDPPSKDSPRWLEDLRSGDYGRFDRVLVASQFTRNAQLWLRFLLLLAGDIEPNPGPNAKKRVPRGPLDLTVGFAPATSHRMNACLGEFSIWLQQELNIKLEQLSWDFVAAPLALRAYGMQLFQEGAPRYLFVYTLTGFQDLFPHMRNHLTSAWQVDRKWQQFEPGECRPVVSAPITQAITSLCLLWGWHRWLGVTLLGFLGMLHPSEFVGLTRRDLLLPADSLMSDDVCYIHIRNPKTARFARRQHCKIDDVVSLRYLEKVFGHLEPSVLLFGGGIHAYRRRWNAVLSRLNVPCGMKQRGATPSVLRGSGATFMYLQCEDLCRIQWRGRWSQLRTVEHYIQEVAAQTLLHTLSPLAKEQIKLMSSAAPILIDLFLKSVDAVKVL